MRVSDVNSGYPLTSNQQSVWFDQSLHPGAPLYNIGAAVNIVGPIDELRLQRAINLVANGHDALRIVLKNTSGIPRQTILPSVDVPLRVVDFSDSTNGALEAQAYLQQALCRPFELVGNLLWECELVRVAASHCYWLCRHHHIGCDGVGIDLMLREVEKAYNGLSTGGDAAQAVSGPTYLDFVDEDVSYLDSPRYESDKAFWARKHPVLAPPIVQREGIPTDAVASGQVCWDIPRPLFIRLSALAAEHGGSIAHLLLSVVATYFARVHEMDEFVVGFAVHNRSTARHKCTIGMFSSVMPLTIGIDRAASVLETSRSVAVELRRCYRHQRFPIAEINRRLKPAQSGRQQIFDVTFSFEDFGGEYRFGETVVSMAALDHGYEQMPLAISVRDYHPDTAVTVAFNYNQACFDASQMEAIAARISGMLDEVARHPHIRVGEVPLLTGSEANKQVIGFNAGAFEFPRDRLAHQQFEMQASRQPDAPAMAGEGVSIGYAELNSRANRVAHRLLALGVRPDDRVGLCLRRGPDLLVGLLGILKAGAAYLPLDPDYPQQRLAYMLEDAAPVALLSETAQLPGLPAAGLPTILLDADPALEAQSDANPDSGALGLSGNHLAYVIYTSGSTGQPKGVMVEHRNLVHQIATHRELCRLMPGDRMLQFASISFDSAVVEIFPTLATGATVVLRPSWLQSPDADFVRYLDQQQVTITDLPTAFWSRWTQQIQEGRSRPGAAQRLVVVGGEKVEQRHLRAWLEAPATTACRWLNTYGPTEATVYSTAIGYDAGAACPLGEVTIGRPTGNSRVYLLDAHGQLLPPGAVGEIHIGGAGVARGYLDRPELTAARFIGDRFGNDPLARLYRTGDLGRWRSDGTLEFLGRNDFQVKIRGFRIELGEIEARLATHVDVCETVVVAREDVPGDLRLVAYVVPRAGAAPGARELRAYLASHLAEHMLPTAYVLLADFPITPNGKVDRMGLPAPGPDAAPGRSYVEPSDALERMIATLWQELLGLERVGRDDNFFELGGHSLLVVALIERLRKQGIAATVRTVFTAPSLSALAASLRGTQGLVAAAGVAPPNLIPDACTAITPQMLSMLSLTQPEIDALVAAVPEGAANIQDIYPLAPLQEGMLFHHLLDGEGDAYLMHTQLAFDDRRRLDAFVVALQQVIARHDVLRTAVHWQNLSAPVQVVQRRAKLPVRELVLSGEGDALAQLRAATDPRHTRLDLRQAPLMAAYVAAEPGSGRWLLALLDHHIVCDHVTLELMIEEVGLILQGQAETLQPPVPYRHFIAHTQASSNAGHERYFREQLGEVSEPTAPFGVLEVHTASEQVCEALLHLGPDLSGRVREVSRAQGMSPAVLFHLAWALVVGRCSSQDEALFGTVLAGRSQGSAGADRAMGLFLNTLPVRIPLTGLGVRDALHDTRRRLTDLLAHEQAPLALAQRCSGVAPTLPLFTAMFNYRHTTVTPIEGEGGITIRGWDGMRVLAVEERTNYPLGVAVDDLGDGFAVRVKSVDDIEPQRVVSYFEQAVVQLEHALAHDPALPLQCIDILPETERRAHRESNAFSGQSRGVACPSPWQPDVVTHEPSGSTNQAQATLVHQSFSAWAQHRPDGIAVSCDGREWTYAEIDAQSDVLAARLSALGVGPEQLIGLCVGRSVHMVVGVLGILKAGAGYVPLDPAYPPDRLRYMIQDSRVSLAVCESRLQALLSECGAASLPIDSVAAASIQSVPVAAALQSPDNLAYVIYTSGSTGRPKGVMATHAGLANIIGAYQAAFPLQPGQRVLHFVSLSFDAASAHLFLALCSGATLHIHDRNAPDAPELSQALRKQRINYVGLPVSVLGALPDADLPDLRFISTGTEACPMALLQRWGNGRRFVNIYGPTETSICSTMAVFDAGRDCSRLRRPPIGRPVCGTRIHVLDRHLRPVPFGVTGELYIGGLGVTRGYFDRPGMTAERFLPDPCADMAGARMYRTGDMVRLLANGDIDFVGRVDNQVKLRGFRIELGEVEARLREHPAVREAAATVWDSGTGNARLVAYVVGRDLPPSADLQAFTGATLPSHMVPGAVVAVERLPLTANGKLDRRALPQPDLDALARSRYVAPRGPIEQQLVQMWQEILKHERIGIVDNFFDLGGHSLLATQLVVRINRDFGIAFPLKAVFEAPTIEALAQRVEAMLAGAGNDATNSLGQATMPALPEPVRHPARVGEPLPLSYAQQRLWFLEQMNPDGAAHNICGALRLSGVLDVDALRGAFSALQRRHDVLRTRFVEIQGMPMQLVEEQAPFELAVIDAGPHELERLLSRHALHSFDLSGAPLLRVGLVRHSQSEHVLLLNMHHIISDGWSLGVLMSELAALYRAGIDRVDAPMPLPHLQYADYARWQREWLGAGEMDRQLAFWRERLTALPPLLELPTDRPRPRERSARGACETFSIPNRQIEGLRVLCREEGATLFMGLLAAFKVLLARLTEEEDIFVGTLVANRGRAEFEPMIGFFVNTLVLRNNVDPLQDFRAFLRQVRASTLDAYTHQDLPFEQLVEALKPPRSLSYSPLFQVLFSMQNTPGGKLELPGLSVEILPGDLGTAAFDLSLDFKEHADGLHGEIEYATDLFESATIRCWIDCLIQIISEGARDASLPLGAIALQDRDESLRLQQRWQGERVPMPLDTHVPALIAAQARRQPDAIAYSGNGVQLSYAELDRRSNRLSRALREHGVGAEVVVGVCLSRGPDLAVAVLAVWKAGGVYLPMDPEYPLARLQFMLEDAAAVLVLTHGATGAASAGLATLSPAMLDLDRDAAWINGHSLAPVESGGSPSSLAYLIYTSGSTGTPKGVQVDHRALAQHCHGVVDAYGLEEHDRVLHFAALGFDISLDQLLPPLVAGATVVARDRQMWEPRQLAEKLVELDITVADLPSALWHVLAKEWSDDAQLPLNPRLRLFMVGGEAMASDSLRHWRRTRYAHVPLLNGYGPTETTITSSGHFCVREESGGTVPIGRPFANRRFYVLDRRLQPLPPCVPGELYIGGEGLARGYRDLPGTTASAFVPDPYADPADAPGQRMYRTGDRVRYRADGALEYLGRADSQVKLHGYRIELEEVEAVLRHLPGVRDAAAAVRLLGNSDRRLVAYVVADSPVALDPATLRQRLASQLPEHFVPSVFMQLDVLPMHNGKIHRKLLPTPDMADDTRYVAPRNDTETWLATLWAELLGLPQVGIDSDFFALGGHSLLAIQLLARVRSRTGFSVPVRQLFDAPTVAAMATHLRWLEDIRNETTRAASAVTNDELIERDEIEL